MVTHEFEYFHMQPKLRKFVKKTKLSYLRHLTYYQENKDTLLSATFKVEENKVALYD